MTKSIILRESSQKVSDHDIFGSSDHSVVNFTIIISNSTRDTATTFINVTTIKRNWNTSAIFVLKSTGIQVSMKRISLIFGLSQKKISPNLSNLPSQCTGEEKPWRIKSKYKIRTGTTLRFAPRWAIPQKMSRHWECTSLNSWFNQNTHRGFSWIGHISQRLILWEVS